VTAEPECALTELPASMCACPAHRGGYFARQVDTVWPPFEAFYEGRCERCEQPIQPGQHIHRTADDAGYVHERCPR
jgi:hypothetical protein